MDCNCAVCWLAKLECPCLKAGAKVHHVLNEVFGSQRATHVGLQQLASFRQWLP